LAKCRSGSPVTVKLHPKAALDFAICSLPEILVPLLVSVPFLTLYWRAVISPYSRTDKYLTNIHSKAVDEQFVCARITNCLNNYIEQEEERIFV